MQYDALELAKLVLFTCREKRIPIHIEDISYILFRVQYEWMKVHKQPLLEELFEAWRCGPILPSAQYYFTVFTGSRQYYDVTDCSLSSKEREDVMPFINAVLMYSPNEIHVADTRKGGAWYRTYDSSRAGIKRCVISTDVIFEEITGAIPSLSGEEAT